MGHGGNVIDELMADHREVEDMFSHIQPMTGMGQELRDLSAKARPDPWAAGPRPVRARRPRTDGDVRHAARLRLRATLVAHERSGAASRRSSRTRHGPGRARSPRKPPCPPISHPSYPPAPAGC